MTIQCDNVQNMVPTRGIGSDNGLAPSRRQAIIWTNGENKTSISEGKYNFQPLPIVIFLTDAIYLGAQMQCKCLAHSIYGFTDNWDSISITVAYIYIYIYTYFVFHLGPVLLCIWSKRHNHVDIWQKQAATQYEYCRQKYSSDNLMWLSNNMVPSIP